MNNDSDIPIETINELQAQCEPINYKFVVKPLCVEVYFRNNLVGHLKADRLYGDRRHFPWYYQSINTAGPTLTQLPNVMFWHRRTDAMESIRTGEVFL